MSIRNRCCLALSFSAVVIIIVGACESLTEVAPDGSAAGVSTPQVNPPAAEGGISKARANAARLINGAETLKLDILQRDPTAVPAQVPCDPLGNDAAAARWTSRIGGEVTLMPNLAFAEYDYLATIGETDYIVSIRVPNPSDDPTFTQVEFSFRAVNPFAFGHAPGADYIGNEAIYPSNDDVIPNRSLIDLDGEDVAIIVQGINFLVGAPPDSVESTRGYMNALGPFAWVLFMRDSQLPGGRFYNISGAAKGGPVAFADVPLPGPPLQGLFQSAQVTGDNFDMLSEHPGNMDPDLAVANVCLGGAPLQPYAFFDFPNLDENGADSPGEAGFLLVVRPDAFNTGPGGTTSEVVIDASGMPATITNADLIGPFPSGDNEPAVIAINHGSEEDHTADGPAGVHEIGVSVFFIHRGREIEDLELTSLCSQEPTVMRMWQVLNPNTFPVQVTWEVLGTGETDTYSAAPGFSFFGTTTIPNPDPNTTALRWQDEHGVMHEITVDSTGGVCP